MKSCFKLPVTSTCSLASAATWQLSDPYLGNKKGWERLTSMSGPRAEGRSQKLSQDGGSSGFTRSWEKKCKPAGVPCWIQKRLNHIQSKRFCCYKQSCKRFWQQPEEKRAYYRGGKFCLRLCICTKTHTNTQQYKYTHACTHENTHMYKHLQGNQHKCS